MHPKMGAHPGAIYVSFFLRPFAQNCIYTETRVFPQTYCETCTLKNIVKHIVEKRKEIKRLCVQALGPQQTRLSTTPPVETCPTSFEVDNFTRKPTKMNKKSTSYSCTSRHSCRPSSFAKLHRRPGQTYSRTISSNKKRAKYAAGLD